LTAPATIVSLAASRVLNNVSNPYFVYAVTSAGQVYESINNGSLTKVNTAGVSGTILDMSASRDNIDIVRTSTGNIYQFNGITFSQITSASVSLAAVSSRNDIFAMTKGAFQRYLPNNNVAIGNRIYVQNQFGASKPFVGYSRLPINR
jgi:predicted transcriptional regulator